MSRDARFSSAGALRLAERALAGELGSSERDELAGVLEHSAADREAYDRLSSAMCALERREHGLSAAAQDRILDGVLAATRAAEVDAVAAAARRRPSWGERWLVALGALAAALLVALGLYFGGAPPSPRPQRGVLQTRGLVSHSDGSRYGLGLYCVRAGAVVDAPPRTVALSPDARCRADDELQLTLTHVAPRRGERYPYLLVLGYAHDQRGAARRGPRQLYYYPVPPTGRSARAPLHQRAEPLGQALRLSVNHRPGRARLVAVFSKKPFDASTVHAWLARIGWHEHVAAHADELGDGVIVVARRLEVTPRKEAPR